jgi:hypothetical protein
MHGTLCAAGAGEAIGVDDRRWDTIQAGKAADDVKQVTLLAWRTRHGFLGGTEPGRTGKAGYRYSFLDICVIRVVSIMSEAGIGPKHACSAEWHLRAQIAALVERGSASPIFVASRGASESDFYYLGVDEPISCIKADVAIVVNLARVIAHVLAKLDLSIEDRKEPDRE